MACTIKRNTEGKVTAVETPQGTESLLFKEINSIPYMADTETSLTAFMNSYSDIVQKSNVDRMENGEPKLYFKTPDNKLFDNLEEAIISNSKGKIRAGFLEAESGNIIDILNFNTLASKESIFITDKIQEGLMSAERVLGKDGINRFQAKGEFLNTRELNALILADRWKAELGNPRVVVNKKGEIEVDQTEDFVQIEWSNGKTETVHYTLAEEYLKKEGVTNKPEVFSRVFSERLVNDSLTASDPTVDIKDSLMRFLQDMGFTTTTLERYSENYRTKHSEDPDIDALVDIANKVVAFSRGEMSIENLTEEVAHIAIELFNDQNSIVEAMANVVLTPEYQEFSEYYRQKYSEKHQGQKLEEMVRKEVLGKILAKHLANNFQNDSAVKGPLQRIWNNIVQYFRSRIKPFHQRHLDQLNARIADSVLANTIEDFQNAPSEGSIFYSAQPREYKKIQQELEKQKKGYEDLFKNALKETVPNRAELENIVNLVNEVDIISTATTMVGIADAQSKVLKGRIEKAKRNNQPIQTKDESAYGILESNLIPSMNSVANILRREVDTMQSPRMKEQATNLIGTMELINNRMASIKPELGDNKKRLAREQLEEVLAESTFTEEEKDKIRENLEGGIYDNTWVGANFGLASQSRNVLIQLLHTLAVRINSNTRLRFNKMYNRIVTEAISKDLMKHQADLLYKPNGEDSHYILSPRDYHWDEKQIEAETVRLLQEKTGLKEEEVREAMKKNTIEEILLKQVGPAKVGAELQDLYNKRSDFRRTLKERPRTEEYYEKAEERFNKAGVDDSTIRYLRTKNVAKGERDKNFLDENGKLDNSLKEEYDLQLDRDEKKDYNAAKSPIDASGHVKEGLIVKDFNEMTEAEKSRIPEGVLEILNGLDYVGDVTIPEGSLEDLSMESRRALDLQNLNFVYRGELKSNEKGGASDAYGKKVKELDKKGEAYEWVMANSSMHFTSEYYESLGDGPSYFSIVEEYVEGLANEGEKQEKLLVIERIKSLQRARRNVLKQNRRSNSAIETDVSSMTSLTMATIKRLDQDIQKAKADMRLPEEIYNRLGEIEFQGESSLNEDYWKSLKESGLSAYDFSLEHMTGNNRTDTEDFARQVEDYILGRRYSINRKYERFMDRFGEAVGERSDQERIARLKDLYAQSKVVSYYKRFQPEGYTEMIDAMKSGKLKMQDAINKTEEALYDYPALEYMEITPDYAWQNDVSGDDMVNPNFKKDGMTNQPKKLNDQFFEFFGIKKEDYLASMGKAGDELRNLTPTKNKEAYELLIMITDTHKEIHKLYKREGNPYELQQISNKRMEKMFNLRNAKENTVDLVTDVFKSKRDEKEYGEELSNGTTVRSIPQYYQSRLESPSIVSKNLMTSAMVSLEEAIRYEERLNAETKVKAVEYQIGEQRLIKRWGSKTKNRITERGQVSNTHKRAQEMVDNMLYGIRQSRKMVIDIGGREIDLTQAFTNLTKYSTLINLALSPIVEATSYTTGLYNNIIDTYVEEYYSKESGIWAGKKIRRMIYDYVQEAGRFTKESELSHLMEFMGIVDANDKINESLRSLPIRMLDKSYFSMAKLANLPVTPRNMLAVMKDYKWYAPEGRFVSRNDFLRIKRVENKDVLRSAVEQEWSKMTDSFYDNITIDKKRGVEMSSKFKEKFQNQEEAKQAFSNYQAKLTSKIQSINQNIDSVMTKEDQIIAKRDVALNAFLQHRSFFIINMTKAFKGRMANLSTGQVEQGHFAGLLKIASKIFKNARAGRSLLEQMEEQERRNLKRLKVSTIAFAILAAAVHGLDAGDDDDNYALRAAQLIGLRTVAESMSIMPIGMAGETIGMYKQPIPQTRLLESFYKGTEALLTGDTEEFYNNIGKTMLFPRRYSQLSDMDNQVNSYKHFNKESLGLIGLAD